MANLDSCVEKQRHYSADKGPYSQGYGLSSGHVWLWELNHKEGRVPRIDAFLTLCDPMDCSTPGFPVLHYLREFVQIQVHWVGDANHLILCCPFFFFVQSFQASQSFPLSWLFASSGQSVEASASVSVLPMNIRGWIPFRLSGLISLQTMRLQESSLASQYKSINSSVPSLFYGPTLTSIHDFWENHNCDYTEFCQQSDDSAF